MTTSAAALAFLGGALGAVPGLWWVRSGRWQRDGDLVVRPPWWWVLVAGLATVVVWWRLGDQSRWPAAIAATVMVVLGGAGMLIDLAVKRVPEPLVLGLYAAVALTLAGGALATGQWGAVGRAVACGVAVWVFFFLYALLTRLGFADVQLMGLCALVLGWVGWWPGLIVAPVVLAAGGVAAVVLLALGRRGTFPFAPSVLAGFLLTLGVYA